MEQVKINRRTFLVTATAFAGGMSLSLAAPAARAASISGEPWLSNAGGVEFSPWIAIAPDDTVIIRVATPEIGNGTVTQTPMNVTEELACDWSKVRVEFASPRRDYLENQVYSKAGWMPFFAGHATDSDRMKIALQIGASARERLKAAAAHQWNVQVADIEARNSVLTHVPTGRKLRYGEVAAKAATIQLKAEPTLKPQSEWTFLGKASPAKLNLPEIVRGSAVYGLDVRLPGMVYAALLQSPVQGGRLKSHDPGAVLKMPGVRAVVVVDPSKTKGIPASDKANYKLYYGLAETAVQSAVAVIADHYWQAKKALDALPVVWEPGPGADWKSSEQIYDAAMAVLDKPATKVLHTAGDVNAVTDPPTLDLRYLTPYCDSAPLEPLNGTAVVTPDKVEVWHPAQDPQQAWWVAVDETGLAPDKVYFHQTYVGGAFGRRVLANDVRMVVAVAKEYPGVPVHVIWSREEMTRQGRYRTLIATRFQAHLDGQGMPQVWKAQACLTGPIMVAASFADSPYVVGGAIPNVQIGTSDLPMHILTGAYRGPWYNSFVFMVETFIDECALTAKADPLAYRLKLLANWDPAWSKCLQVAADKAGWGKPLPRGQGQGIAVAAWPTAGLRQTGTIICAVATVEVSPDGVLKVKSIDVAFDCGRVANRDAVAAQLEGGAIHSLNMSLNEEITVRNGAVVEGNFDQYPMLRMGDIPPRITIHFDALSDHDRFGIVGEAPIGPIGPAVGNAIFQATGKRMRTTPFRKHDLTWT
ncbi:MAG: xanthine dehydrogenase family protein molybdopterin-binding subunit [Rhodospirillaceae bacterium]|nr:MAG: xanthine dehydrogenase family protein molybdopterin-binding subunit [Rhodospirillaceae bacterium]